jgi:hypothetical protein
MNQGGKGDKPRPFSVTQEEYDNRWDMIFNRDKKSEAEKFDEKVIMNNECQDILSTEDCINTGK